MRSIFHSAALLVALAAASGADAQRLTAEPVLDVVPVSPRDASNDAQLSVSRDIFKSIQGIGLSARTYTERDGSTSTRRGLIGNWSIGGALEAGVGLFSVAGDARKHNEFKRAWSAKQVTPKSGNIAAVGMRLRF